MGTSRAIDRDTIDELYTRVASLEKQFAVIRNRKAVNTPIRSAADLPPIAAEGDLVTVDDTEVCYVWVNGAWVQLGGGSGGGDWDVTVTKTLDENTPNTTNNTDDELTFTIAAGTFHIWELNVIYASPIGGATPDLAVQPSITGFTNIAHYARGYSTADAFLGTANIAANASNSGTATTKRMVVMQGWLFGTGTWSLLYRQVTSNANPVVSYAGGFVRYKTII